MVQIIDQQGNIAGRIGKGFGKSLSEGLAEQIPKEAERYRLAEGLKKLGQKKNADTWENFTELASLPGGSPQLIESGSRLLEQRANRNARNQEVTEKDKTKNQGAESRSREAQDIERQTQERNPSVTTVEPVQATLKPYISPSMGEMRDAATKRQNKYPGLHPDFQGYLNEEISKDQQENAIQGQLESKRLKEQNVQQTIRNEIDEQFKSVNVDTGPGLGEYKKSLTEQAYKDVKNGLKTETQAAADATKEALATAKDINKIKEYGSQWFPNADEQKKAIKNISKKFSEKGLEDLNYSELQSNLKLTPSYAKYLSNPYSKEYNNFLSKTKNHPNYGKEGYKTLGLTNQIDKSRERDVKVARELVNNIKPKDSILSGLLNLKNKGYDSGNIMEEIRDLYNSGKISLSPSQKDELDQDPNQRQSIDDLYYFHMSGLDKLLEMK